MGFDKKRAGGNTSRPGGSYDMLKWGSSASPDVKAYVGRVLASGGFFDDTEYGLSCYGPTPEGASEGDGGNWETVNVGKAPVPNRSRPRRGSSGKG